MHKCCLCATRAHTAATTVASARKAPEERYTRSSTACLVRAKHDRRPPLSSCLEYLRMSMLHKIHIGSPCYIGTPRSRRTHMPEMRWMTRPSPSTARSVPPLSALACVQAWRLRNARENTSLPRLHSGQPGAKLVGAIILSPFASHGIKRGGLAKTLDSGRPRCSCGPCSLLARRSAVPPTSGSRSHAADLGQSGSLPEIRAITAPGAHLRTDVPTTPAANLWARSLGMACLPHTAVQHLATSPGLRLRSCRQGTFQCVPL